MLFFGVRFKFAMEVLQPARRTDVGCSFSAFLCTHGPLTAFHFDVLTASQTRHTVRRAATRPADSGQYAKMTTSTSKMTYEE